MKRMDPPAVTAGRRRDIDGTREWTLLLGPLTKKPGVWHLVRAYETNGAANTAAYSIRQGRKAGLPAGKWDATARDGALYVCFLGGRGK
jgi:hypothetical protein